MSKFIDLLTKAGQQSPAPMGFSPASTRAEAAPEIVLVARVLPGPLAKVPELVDSDADVYSLGADLADEKGTDGAAKALKDRVWGVRSPEELRRSDGQKLAKKGCDFVVFGSWDTEATLLNEEDLGVVVTVRVTTTEKEGRFYAVPPMDEESVHALSELAHGLLLSPAIRDLPLSVETAVDIQRILSVVDKPLIVEAPEGIGPGDLGLLRNMGVAGLYVDLDRPEDLKRIAEVKKAIDALPRRRPRDGRRDALVPSTPTETPSSMPEPDEDDDDY